MAGSDPCPGEACNEAAGQTCNETTDACEGQGCLHEVDFESGAGGWTTGAFCTQPNSSLGIDDVDNGTMDPLPECTVEGDFEAGAPDWVNEPASTCTTAAIPAGSSVKLRMQYSDGAGPGDLVECGIDDFSICPTP